MKYTKLTQNFTLNEFTRSETAERFGIDMSVEVGSEIYLNILRLCIEILQPVRDALGPVHILSGWRPRLLNNKIGGAKTSQHIEGLAVDFVVTGYTPLEVARWIRQNIPEFDQLIHEYGRWVHVSLPAINATPRFDKYTAIKVPHGLFHRPKTQYVIGLFGMEEAKERVA